MSRPPRSCPYPDSQWRDRAAFLRGRDAIEAFLTRKWQRELGNRTPCALPT